MYQYSNRLAVPPTSTRRIPKSPETGARNWEGERFTRLARAAFPAATEHHLSVITGIPARTIEKHLRGETKPGADHFIAYLNAGLFGRRLALDFLPNLPESLPDHGEALRAIAAIASAAAGSGAGDGEEKRAGR